MKEMNDLIGKWAAIDTDLVLNVRSKKGEILLI